MCRRALAIAPGRLHLGPTIAVIDIGKTNAKVVLFDLATSSEVAARTVPNRVLDTAPYPHFDTEALWTFILSALKELHAERGFEAISITAHSAAPCHR